jgi:hypothetical protein
MEGKYASGVLVSHLYNQSYRFRSIGYYISISRLVKWPIQKLVLISAQLHGVAIIIDYNWPFNLL